MITATGRRKRCECTMCDWHDAVHGVSVSVRSHREICSDGAECGNHNLRHYTITTNMTQTTSHANATRDKRCQYMHHSKRAGEVKQSMASSNTTLGNGGLQPGEQYGFNLNRMGCGWRWAQRGIPARSKTIITMITMIWAWVGCEQPWRGWQIDTHTHTQGERCKQWGVTGGGGWH